MKQKWENCNDTSLKFRTQEHKITVARPTERSAMKVSSVSPLQPNKVKYINERNFIGFGKTIK